MEKLEQLCTAGKNAKWHNHYEANMAIKNLNSILPQDLAILLMDIHTPKRITRGFPVKYLCSMFVEALLSIILTQEDPVPMSGQISKWNVIRPYKRKATVAHATVQASLDAIMLK